MNDSTGIDFGPLTALIGVWKGDKGVDIAPEPDGEETNPFFETITFLEVGGVTNAESQNLSALHYHQIVSRKSDGAVFHNETGYWMWDAENKTVMHSLHIPRAVGLIAGGTYNGEKDADGRIILKVMAKLGDKNWGIIQSPFMRDKASTQSFEHEIIIGNGKLTYTETTMVDIYGKVFEHTDQNELELT
ncbi:MAG: FABP family protein [Rhodospirillaceae bacterium]|nr:FABP family protein [Rhodospirillaceae bacterium]